MAAQSHKRGRSDDGGAAPAPSNWDRLQQRLPPSQRSASASSSSAPCSSSSSSSSSLSSSASSSSSSPALSPPLDAEAQRRAAALATLRGPFPPPPPPALQGEEARVVALDCEMVGVGTEGRSALALVVVVDWFGREIFKSFCRPAEAVTDYRTFVSGVAPEHLRGAPDFRAVQKRVFELLSGKLLVGHGLKNDLEALLLHHDVHSRRDTAHYLPLMRRNAFGVARSQKLKQLVLEHLGAHIQVEGAAHDPAEDARSALAVYKLFRLQWERDEAQRHAAACKKGRSKQKAAAKARRGVT